MDDAIEALTKGLGRKKGDVIKHLLRRGLDLELAERKGELELYETISNAEALIVRARKQLGRRHRSDD
ncbi:MAG TPA: hypothetical protein VMY76_00555 [Gemmatimonadales bacterium]|nr:hypothetical protein [Gemmatimonadales bacterium]